MRGLWVCVSLNLLYKHCQVLNFFEAKMVASVVLLGARVCVWREDDVQRHVWQLIFRKKIDWKIFLSLFFVAGQGHLWFILWPKMTIDETTFCHRR